MELRFEPLKWPDDGPAIADFLSASEWPFHGAPNGDQSTAAQLAGDADDIASFWIRQQDETIGLIRLMDLADVEVGSPLFDLRVTEAHRGRGVGRRAVAWLTNYLFTTYPALHRIEATTRDDNVAMRAVFARCGYRLEGRFVEAWPHADGTRFDALAYAILRREHLHTSDIAAD